MAESGGPAATRRLFFALWPPARLAVELDHIATAAARRFGGKASRRANLHLTLYFLGEVADARLPLLLEAARRVRAAGFRLRIDRLGYWRHNRLLWAGCAPSAGLGALFAELEAALALAGQPPPKALRAFTPHLTLARKLPAATSPDEVRRIACAGLPDWPCEHFTLAESTLSPGGSIYRPLAEFALMV